MKGLARVFSFLVLAFLIWAGWMLMRQERPVPARTPPPITRPETPAPTPGVKLPDFWNRLPQLFPKTPPAPPPIALTTPVQRILIEKSARRMTVFQKDGPAKTYQIALGRVPAGDKTRQGDGRTPEGVFKIDRLNRQSRFHLSLGLDYPQPQQRRAARAGGYDPGGDIMIHGQPKSVPEGYRVKGDWTEGCIAVSDAEIREIFAQTKIGTEVEIRP